MKTALSKNWRIAPKLGFVFGLLALVATTSRAQNFTIDWFTIDGGGGTSTGGIYSVSGTIGQPDAGTLSGGVYTLNGGFWNDALNVAKLFLPLILR